MVSLIYIGSRITDVISSVVNVFYVLVGRILILYPELPLLHVSTEHQPCESIRIGNEALLRMNATFVLQRARGG